MIANFLAIASHPVLSMMLFFVDVIVIWGLFNYGGRDRTRSRLTPGPLEHLRARAGGR